MGASKTDQYSLEQKKFAKTAKALGHPARIAIVQYLSVNGPSTNKDLTEITELSDATVSQHVRELRMAGMIVPLFVGKQQYHKLNTGAEDSVKHLYKVINASGYF